MPNRRQPHSRSLRHIEQLLPGLDTRAVAEPAWHDHGQVHVTESLAEADALADSFASEHVRILTENPRDALKQMPNYGALFLGERTCVPYGDKLIGPITCYPRSVRPATSAACGSGSS